METAFQIKRISLSFFGVGILAILGGYSMRDFGELFIAKFLGAEQEFLSFTVFVTSDGLCSYAITGFRVRESLACLFTFV
jgi:hypothetical protein